MRERAPGLSVRLKLTLSYAAFVVIVGVAVFIVGFLVLRFVPDGNLYAESGIFTPRRRDLTDVFVRYAWYAVLALAVVVVLALLRRCTRRLGGVTGDVLGAGVELALAVLLLAFSAPG